jgi:hypothetical protein
MRFLIYKNKTKFSSRDNTMSSIVLFSRDDAGIAVLLGQNAQGRWVGLGSMPNIDIDLGRKLEALKEPIREMIMLHTCQIIEKKNTRCEFNQMALEYIELCFITLLQDYVTPEQQEYLATEQTSRANTFSKKYARCIGAKPKFNSEDRFLTLVPECGVDLYRHYDNKFDHYVKKLANLTLSWLKPSIGIDNSKELMLKLGLSNITPKLDVNWASVIEQAKLETLTALDSLIVENPYSASTMLAVELPEQALVEIIKKFRQVYYRQTGGNQAGHNFLGSRSLPIIDLGLFALDDFGLGLPESAPRAEIIKAIKN